MGLELVLANQFLGQLPESLCQAVLGNVSTLYVFRVGGEDAPILARELGLEAANAATLTDTQNFTAVCRTTNDGVPGSPFRMEIALPDWPRKSMLASVIKRTEARYTRPPKKVEAHIARIFQ